MAKLIIVIATIYGTMMALGHVDSFLGIVFAIGGIGITWVMIISSVVGVMSYKMVK